MNAGKRKLSICTVLALLAASVGSNVRAEVNVGMSCTASRWPTNPPAITETGLGDDVDKLAYVPERLRSEIQNLKANKWEFLTGPNSRTERKNKKIYIQETSSLMSKLALLSHETGHAIYSPIPNYSSKDAYLKIACLDEGMAVYENIVARNVIQACPAEQGGHLDIGLAAATPWEPYLDYIANSPLPLNYADLGMMFCKSNINSITGQNYLDYYGDWYDRHYGSQSETLMAAGGVGSGLPKATPSFWEMIDKLAKASVTGADNLSAIWPSTELHEQQEASPRFKTLKGDRYQLDANTLITSSTLTANTSLNVMLANIDIEGICVTRQDIEQHYPDLVLLDIPRGPGELASWGAYGLWGRINFAFENDGRCLSSVAFDPTAKVPQAYPNDQDGN